MDYQRLDIYNQPQLNRCLREEKKNKLIAIPIIAVLVVASAGFGFMFAQESGKLKDAQAEISSLKSNVSSLQGQISTLNTEADQAAARIGTLEGDLGQTQETLSQTQDALNLAENSYDLLNQRLGDARPYAEIFERYFFVNELTEQEFYAMDDAIGLLADRDVRIAWNAIFYDYSDEAYYDFVDLLWDVLWEILYLP